MYFSTRELYLVLFLLAFSFLIYSLTRTLKVKLERETNYKVITANETFSSHTEMALAIALANLGSGAYSLIFLTPTIISIYTICYLMVSGLSSS